MCAGERQARGNGEAAGRTAIVDCSAVMEQPRVMRNEPAAVANLLASLAADRTAAAEQQNHGQEEVGEGVLVKVRQGQRAQQH